jgi:outer membrane receptor protein involved in Fe transport
LTAASVLALLAVPNSVWAQDETTPQDQAQTVDIIVTGSRVARSTFTSPNPVTVIGAEQIAQMGQVNIAETIQTLPQNLSKVSDTNTGLTASTVQYSVGASIADLRGLNPLNGVRTLTLVNTKRFVPSTTGGGVDMNLIPSMLVRSVETVTGGASAAYGTDALAGVVNVILDTKLTGMKAQFDYGQTFQNDGKTYHWSLAGGTGFAGGRGHIIFGAEWQNSGAVGDCVYARSWCAKSPDIFVNELNATNGQPRYIRGNEGAYANYDMSTVLRGSTLAPRVNAPGLRNLVFAPDGRSVIEYDPGAYFQAIGFGERQGGDCTLDCSPWSEVQLRPEIQRLALYSRAEFDFTPSLKGFIEGSYGERKSNVGSISLGPSSGTPLRTDYAYLRGVTYFDRSTGTTRSLSDLIAATPPNAAAVASASQAPGVPTVPLFVAKHYRDIPGGRGQVDAELTTWRFMAGFEGDLDILGGWKWDAYYQYGKSNQFVNNSGIRVNRFFMYALDAVDEGLARGGAANGNIVCRATLPGPANTSTPAGFEQHWGQADAAGCVPLNILGTNTENAAAIAYAYRNATEDFTYRQQVAAFNLNGSLFEGWAGPVNLAFGGEYRFEKGFAVHNRLPFNVTNTNNPFGNDFGGSLKILEGYGEVNIPLLKDVPLAESVELDAAFRHTHQTNKDAITSNSKSLDFNTWKVSGTWDVTNWLRFRATRSRDVRAASFVDLYYNLPDTLPGPPAGTILNPWFLQGNGAATNDFTKIVYPPNFTLTPEIGNTLTVGVVLQPHGFLDGLRISVDYYDIKIRDAIVVLSAQQVVDACFTAGAVCDKIFNGAGASFSSVTDATQRRDVENIVRGANNIGSFQQSGWDVEMLYTLPLEKIGASLPGRLTLRGLATITDKMDVNLGNGSGAVSYVNQTGGSAFGGFTAPAKYILTGYATYTVGGFGITLDGKYIPKGIYDIRRSADLPNTNLNSINYNYVESRLYIGLSSSYKFEIGGNDSAEFFFTIRNLFDVAPPNAPSNVSGTLGYVQGGGAPTNPVFFDTIGATWRAGFRLNF